MQTKLVTKKNRKLRRLRELYPEVHIKLFKRGDIRSLMIKYGLDEDQTPPFTGTPHRNENET
ncbi:MAG TPA: hypothetical protein EYP04_03830 [Anaerolineae bacterium]|nr:hypothetical protein [Anaerolineae bacterium]